MFIFLSFIMTQSAFGEEYIEEERLWGIESLTIIDNETISVSKRENQGEGSGLSLIHKSYSKGIPLEIKIGNGFLLTDMHHANMYFELIKIEDETAYFKLTDTFNATSFGDGIKKQTKFITKRIKANLDE